jgi:hypothetical protein
MRTKAERAASCLFMATRILELWSENTKVSDHDAIAADTAAKLIKVAMNNLKSD